MVRGATAILCIQCCVLIDQLLISESVTPLYSTTGTTFIISWFIVTQSFDHALYIIIIELDE